MNYRDEQTHDWLLIWLVQELNSIGQLGIVSSIFGTGKLVQLDRAQRRQPFDVELTFAWKTGIKLPDEWDWVDKFFNERSKYSYKSCLKERGCLN